MSKEVSVLLLQMKILRHSISIKNKYRITDVIFDAVTEARKIKPSIPTIDKNDIEIRDEIVLTKYFVMYKYTQLLNHRSSYLKTLTQTKKEEH